MTVRVHNVSHQLFETWLECRACADGSPETDTGTRAHAAGECVKETDMNDGI